MRKLLIVPILCLIAYAAYALTVPFTITVGSGDFAFTPLHLYFIDNALGSDGNDGTAPVSGGGHGPWLTPNHSVVCGDVILVKAGSNSGGWTGGQWGTVSGCPSTSAGIDGNGGIQFAVVLCAGATLGTCNFNGGGNEAFRIDKVIGPLKGLMRHKIRMLRARVLAQRTTLTRFKNTLHSSTTLRRSVTSPGSHLAAMDA